jgi:ubiquinone biosynthesis protein
VEGLGRQLDPQLDLWKTAKPYLERWMHERIGFTGIKKKVLKEASQWSQWLPEFPRLLYAQLSRPDVSSELLSELKRSRQAREQSNRLLVALTGVAALALGVALWALIR